MPLILRTPTPSEFQRIAAFSFQNFIEESAKSSGIDLSILKNKLGEPTTMIRANDFWQIIESDREQIGFIWVRLNPVERTAFGYDIYLEATHRSKGHGRKVMTECCKRLAALGIGTLEICVFENNKVARSLYKSLGFKEKSFNTEQRQLTLSLKLGSR